MLDVQASPMQIHTDLSSSYVEERLSPEWCEIAPGVSQCAAALSVYILSPLRRLKTHHRTMSNCAQSSCHSRHNADMGSVFCVLQGVKRYSSESWLEMLQVAAAELLTSLKKKRERLMGGGGVKADGVTAEEAAPRAFAPIDHLIYAILGMQF